VIQLDLPRIYQNTDINLNNNDQEVFYSNRKINNIPNIKDKINNLFNKKTYIYKINTEIILKDNIIKTTIIGKTNTYLITINNELIPIKDILDIKKLD
jgi:hypothetical protein